MFVRYNLTFLMRSFLYASKNNWSGVFFSCCRNFAVIPINCCTFNRAIISATEPHVGAQKDGPYSV